MKAKILLWMIALILLALPVLAIPSPVGHWTFNGDYTDEKGLNNLADTGAGNSFSTGKIGQALNTTGSGYARNGTTTGLATGDFNHTWTFWIKLNGNSTYHMFVDRGTYSAYDRTGVDFRGNSDNYITASHFSDDVSFSNSPGIPSGVWFHIAMTYNKANKTSVLYKNGVVVDSGTHSVSLTVTQNLLSVAGRIDGNGKYSGLTDDVRYYEDFLTPAEISLIYNGGSGTEEDQPGSASTSNFTITAFDSWNGTQILSFSADINGTQFNSNATGTINTPYLFNNTAEYDIIIFNATNYLNRTYAGYNPNTTGNLQAHIYQAVVCFNATQKVNEAWVTADNFTIGSNTSTSCFNISAGTHNVMAQKSGWYNQNQTFTVTALTNTTQTVQNLSYANLTIYAIDGTTNESLSNYAVYINSIASPTFGESASGVTNQSFYLINDTYNVTIDVPGYAVTTSLANITVSGHTNYTFTLYKSNSVSITIYDEIDNTIITENITVRWTSNSTTWENITTTGELFVHNITPDQYEVTFYGSNYSTRTYTITVGNDSTQFLNAYMISSLYSTIFTIKDIDTGAVLDGVSFQMSKQINSTWTVVESKYSDISGKVQVYYDPIAHYRFYLSVSGYDDLIFYLNPILFSNYDVKMVKASVLNYTVDMDDISIIYSPGPFTNNANSTLNFLISSPDGLLTSYGVTASYPGGSDTATGVNAIGEQLSLDINITNATRWDRVTLTFNYTTSLAGNRSFTRYLGILTNATASENTWLANKDRTFGLGIFERMLVVTIIVIFCVGIATLVGQPIPGVALGLFVFGFMVYIGFAELWLVLPSMLIGILFLVWKSGGY